MPALAQVQPVPPTGSAAQVTPAPGVAPAPGTVASPTVSKTPTNPPTTPPTGSAASVTPAPGVGAAPGTVSSPTVTTASAFVPTTPPTGSASSTRNAPGVGEPIRVDPAPMPVAPAPGAPVMVVPQVRGDAPSPALALQGNVLNGGDRTSAVADSVAPMTSPVALLGHAEQAARQGRLPLASELVERAESLLLTRSTIAGTEAVPVRDGTVTRMAPARVAFGRNDVTAATALMAEAASMTGALGM